MVCSLRALASLRPERLFPSSGNVRRTPLPDLHNKIGYLVKLTHAVAELDATGHSAAEVVTLLFGKETTLRFWTSGHVSAANLVRRLPQLQRAALFVRPAQPTGAL